MKTAEKKPANTSSGNRTKQTFFSKSGMASGVHTAIKAKPTPFFNSAKSIQPQTENKGFDSGSDIVTRDEPKVFTKPKSFWVLENDKGKRDDIALFSKETVTIEQLTHAIFKKPLAILDAFSNINRKTIDQQIPAFTRIRVPVVSNLATSWALKGVKSPLIFRGIARNPFPILGLMGVSNSAEFAHKKKEIEQELEMEKPLMSMYIRLGMEDKFIKILKKYAQRDFTEFPDKYFGGGQYVDKIFVYLNGDIKKIGSFDQVTSAYDLIFNHFTRASEVRQIRDVYSVWFKGDNGIREITYGAVFIEEAFEKALTVAGVPKADIMGFLNKAGDAIADIIAEPGTFLNNLGRAVKSGFGKFENSLPEVLGSGLLSWVQKKIGLSGGAFPESLDPKSILKYTLETLGLDIKSIITEVVGPKNVQRIATVWSTIQTFMKSGVGGLANQLMDYVGDLKITLVDKLKNWVIKDLVKAAVISLLEVLVPGGGLVKVIIKIYDTIQFVRNKLADIKALFVTVGQSVLQIVRGDIDGASMKINETLKQALYLLINLFARVMGINFMDGIKKAIQNLRAKIIGGIKKLVGKIVAGGKGITNKIAGWLGIGEPFTTNQGAEHTLYVRSGGGNRQLIIESDPTLLSTYLKDNKQKISSDQNMDSSEKKKKLSKTKHTQNLLKGLESLMNNPEEQKNPRIPSMIAKITDNIKEIDVSESGKNILVPSAEFNPGFSSGVRATFFSARYVFKGTDGAPRNHDPGSIPNKRALPDAWQVLVDMGLNYRWARFHILNENLGGKGVDSNLIPTPIYINNEYRKELEKDLKGYYYRGLPIWLRANVIYNTSQFAGYFPSHFSATAGAMKLVNEKWVEDVTKQKSFSKQIDIPTPQSFNINKIMNNPKEEMLIKNLTSVTEGILKILRARMPKGGYRNYFQMEKAIEMDVYGVQKNEINTFDEREIMNLQKPSDDQVKEVNRLKGWMSSALYTFE